MLCDPTHLAESVGIDVGSDITSAMRPLLGVQTYWESLVPPEFRCPVPVHAATALATAALVRGWQKMAMLILMSFHYLLRPDEA